jgi:hypothetical protein
MDSVGRKILSKPLCRITLQFVQRPPVEPHAIIHAVQLRASARINGPDKVRMEGVFETTAQRVNEVKRFVADVRHGEHVK